MGSVRIKMGHATIYGVPRDLRFGAALWLRVEPRFQRGWMLCWIVRQRRLNWSRVWRPNFVRLLRNHLMLKWFLFNFLNGVVCHVVHTLFGWPVALLGRRAAYYQYGITASELCK